jgi:methyl-accepting chemotaxis protein
MIGFGVLIGCVFPFFVIVFGVRRSLALSPLFISACMMAGICVGAVNITLTRSIVLRHVKRITGAAGEIAGGDLNVGIAIESADEIGSLSTAFDSMAGKLNDVFSNVCEASHQVTAGAEQLSAISATLARGVSEQASSIEQVTASLDQISVKTKLNAQNAGDANRLVLAARKNAEEGDGRMKEMLLAMDGINRSSADISQVIRVIDDIASQTNILALNAAVEAARAGAAGKGFSVVAEEVRSLAARSATAAGETSRMIEDSIRKAEAGTKLATRTAQALAEIKMGVVEAAALVSRIDEASKDQAVGLTEISQAMNLVSRVIQDNSLVAERSASASSELASQSHRMRTSVGSFVMKWRAEA